MRNIMVTVFAVMLGFCCCAKSPATASSTKATRKLLARMGRHHEDTRKLARAFRIGDDNIDGLISALADPDDNVKLNAQVVIRYLGNNRGMDALNRSLSENRTTMIAGAVPEPLSEWDFAWIEEHFLCPDWRLSGWGCSEYVYALLLDGSPRAKQALSRIVEKFEKFKPSWLPSQAIDAQFEDVKHLEHGLLQHAFWLTPSERQSSTARVLSVTTNRRKALFELYVDQGALAEKWFHVVAVRQGETWKIISITMVAQS